MIGTDDMSTSTGMDISESFRPEDISKSDFFDFVTASEMGIGVVGIGSVSLQTSTQHQQPPYGTQHQQHATTHQQSQNHERLSTTNSNMTHDGGGTSGSHNGNDVSTNNSISNGNTSDPTLQGYEFWHTDKDTSRLDSSIFEDFDRYCWQQPPTTPTTSSAATLTHQQTQHLQTPAISTHNNNNSNSHNNNNNNNNNNTNNSNQCDLLNIKANQNAVTQPHSSPSTTTTLQDNDGQIYTITVLNGGNGEPTTPTATTTTSSWLKRETDESQLPTTLDLDSLLGNFSGYIKSEYPYDDSGFSTDGTKSDGLNGDVNGINSIQQQQQQQQQQRQFDSHTSNTGQTLPSLVMSGFRAGLNIGQHLAAQFQNNNNDWHMMDHNVNEQSSAESLLRSALQGKGYTKGPHQMQNGSITTLMPTGSPTVKDDEMRRMLFSTDADSLAFADSTLNAAQIFDDSQHHAQLLQLQHPATTPNGSLSQTSQTTNTNLLVDDMFLTLENAFSDDFDKMKRIANEVQQYCHTPPIESDYIPSDIMMQIPPPTTIVAPTTPTTPIPTSANQLQPLNSPIGQNVLGSTQPTSPLTVNNTATAASMQLQRKAEVTTSTTAVAVTTASTAGATTTNNRGINAATKTTKKYKRATSSNTNTHNNNNLNALNHNTNVNATNNSSTASTAAKPASTTSSSTNSATSSGSSSSSSNSPPTSHCNGQRKERSLHYCSICSKGFKDKYSVNVHIRTHTGEKPFACSLCGKSFRQKAHLAKHYQTHMAQKNNHGGSGGAGGGMVKGNAAKHHRGGGSSSSVAAQQRQQLGMLTSTPSNTQMVSSMGTGISNSSSGVNINSGGLNLGSLSTMGLNPNLLGVTSTVVSLNGPSNSACLSANILSSTNGLLTNR